MADELVAEKAMRIIESTFIFKDSIKNQDSPTAKKLKRYCAFLYFYFNQADEKYRMFDKIRPELDIVAGLEANDPKMTIWWWAYLDTIVHTSSLYDKPSGNNEPASLPFLDSKLASWGASLGVKEVPELPNLSSDIRLKTLLRLRDKIVIHVEPASYFKVMNELNTGPDRFFEYLIDDVAKPYLEEVFATFFKNPVKFGRNNELIDNFLKLNLKIQ